MLMKMIIIMFRCQDQNIYIGFKVNDIIRNELMNISDKLGIIGVFNTKISSNEYKLIHEPLK